MNKLDMETVDIVEENIEKIGSIFPNVIVESEKGKSIDFDLLKQELSKEIVGGSKEKYQLTWPGKKEAIITSNTPSKNTLRPIKEKSVDFENTKNIYIEGDNLEALKILQESYLGKIKCIYIDPPYNTGNDFVYKDNFKKSSEEELEDSGQIDEDGNRMVSNSQSNGKFHSDWLSMMYPRLKLARNLLTDDGILFISIDDNEIYNLKKICDEILGENNFISLLTIESGEVFGTKASHVNKTFVKVKDYVLIYAKDKKKADNNEKQPLFDEMRELYDSHYGTIIDDNLNIISLLDYLKNNKFMDKFKKYDLKLSKENISVLMQLDDEFKNYIYNDLSKKLYADAPYNIIIDEEILSTYDNNKPFYLGDRLLYKTSTGSVRMYVRFYDSLKLSDDYIPKFTRCTCRGDLWKGFHFDMRNIDDEGYIKFKNGKKPVRLPLQLIKWLNSDDFYVLDFFSGSGTTAHACFKYNCDYKKHIKFIMVQLPEKCNEKSEAYKDGYSTICEIGEERIKRAAQEIKKETNADIDYGFRVYKIDSSNMKDVYYKPNEITQEQLDLFESNIKEDRTGEDLLTQVMLDLGLTLDLKIEERTILNNKVYYVADNALVACFDDKVDINIIDEICKCHPLKVVFKDSSFNTDKDKINLEEKIKKLSPETEISIL